jgi:hypothetical protein
VDDRDRVRPEAEAPEARYVTEGATGHRPVASSSDGYGPDNTRPSWVDQLPDPDTEVVRFTVTWTADHRYAFT